VSALAGAERRTDRLLAARPRPAPAATESRWVIDECSLTHFNGEMAPGYDEDENSYFIVLSM
jgi:hypothetical protein